MAKWLNAPVVLVLDAQAQARSAAAVVLGFEQFDPAMQLAAVIANQVGGEAHARWIREAVAARCRARVVGAIPRDESVALAERHLGLMTAGEGGLTVEKRQRLAELIERSVDLDDVLSLAVPLPVPGTAAPSPSLRRAPRARIGIAHDAAFCFYYRDNLALLEAAGAELVSWSPLDDTVLPAVDGLYFGGGYPELYGATLAGNPAMLTAVRSLASEGRPIYAECGGLMYLADAIEDLDGAHATPPPVVGLYGGHAARGFATGSEWRDRPRPRVSLFFARPRAVVDPARLPIAASPGRGARRRLSDRQRAAELRPSAFRLESRTGAELRGGLRR